MVFWLEGIINCALKIIQIKFIQKSITLRFNFWLLSLDSKWINIRHFSEFFKGNEVFKFLSPHRVKYFNIIFLLQIIFLFQIIFFFLIIFLLQIIFPIQIIFLFQIIFLLLIIYHFYNSISRILFPSLINMLSRYKTPFLIIILNILFNLASHTKFYILWWHLLNFHLITIIIFYF